MGYAGAKFERLFVDDGRAARATRRLAEAGGDFLVARAKDKTPIDTGRLRESWHRKATIEGMALDGLRFRESGAVTDVDYAPYVEHGTGLWGPAHAKYAIRPKTPGGVLHFFAKDGAEVFTKLVMHKGSPGQPMIAPAVQDAYKAWPSYLLPELERFVLEYREIWEKEAARSRAAVALAKAA